MSKEEKNAANADAAQSQQIRVALNSARLRTSYANVFQTRCTAEEIILCYHPLLRPESARKPEHPGRRY
ncbi:hypothetical protein [Desulfovibrio sp.]|uniref:hypothetical protein n=1 Tax=Desulfovibrio sp. TaxID=885 RepID=UPI0025BC3EBC|nr:hypothetical protein [Desulfovibrio sp.]